MHHFDLKHHPAADQLPMLDPERMLALREQISRYGLIEPIILYEGQILDGRNRYECCRQIGLEPRFVDFVDHLAQVPSEEDEPLGPEDYPDPYEFVRITNVLRRDLTPDQRAVIHERLLRLSEEYQASKNKGGPPVGNKNNRFSKVQPNTDSYSLVPSKSDRIKAMNQRSTVGRIASAAKVSMNKARQARKVAKDPDIYDKVAKGEISLIQAVKKIEPQPPEKPAKPRQTLKKWEKVVDGFSKLSFADMKVAIEKIDEIWNRQ